jgi:aryl-alcohol dehydrogenase-like predicted oxidoreductase
MPCRLDDYRLLGRSGLRVSPLALGTMTFGMQGWGSSDEEAARMVDIYVERGGNFIDTANFYGHMGDSERVLGRLVGGRRDSLVISTKYSLSMRPGDPNASGNHRKNMIRSVEASLQRLGTDYVDLLDLHIWDSRTPVEEILRGFDDLVRAGKVLYAGLSDTPAWQAVRMQAIADLRGWSPLIALQIPYNLAERDVEREFMPMAAEMGMGVLPWSPLAGGVLSGKYSRDDLGEAGANLSTRKDIVLSSGRLNPRSLEIAVAVGEVAAELGVTSAQVALAWTLLNPAVVSPVLGARTPAQLEDNLGALDVVFTREQVARLEELSRIELGFPHSMLLGKAIDMMFGGVKVATR